MTVLVWLLLAHVLADFYLQPKTWVEQREQGQAGGLWSALLKHALVHALCTALALFAAMAMNQLSVAWPAVMAWAVIVCSHLLIDWLKSRFAPSTTAFLLDQLAHGLIIVAVWAWLTGFTPFVMAWSLGVLLQREMLVILIIYLLAGRPASFFTAMVLRRQALALAEQTQSQGLVEAGRLIGYVERWLIVSFVLSGQFIGIGFLLAAKSIFRFGDLSQAHERRLTEYMLLGTLVSFATAIALGGLAMYLTG